MRADAVWSSSFSQIEALQVSPLLAGCDVKSSSCLNIKWCAISACLKALVFTLPAARWFPYIDLVYSYCQVNSQSPLSIYSCLISRIVSLQWSIAFPTIRGSAPPKPSLQSLQLAPSPQAQSELPHATWSTSDTVSNLPPNTSPLSDRLCLYSTPALLSTFGPFCPSPHSVTESSGPNMDPAVQNAQGILVLWHDQMLQELMD